MGNLGRHAMRNIVAVVFCLIILPSVAVAQPISFITVADTNTAIPSGTGNFTGVSAPAVSGGQVAFKGTGASQQGMYEWISGNLSVVSDLNTAIPNGTG